MSRLFDGARAFNEDIGAWDTSGVTSMNSMFNDALSFDQDLGGWRVDKVTDMYRMFDDASSFDQDLGWCVDDDVDLERRSTPVRVDVVRHVIQGTCPPSPAPTSAPTPRPTREDEGDTDVGALVASLCVVGAFLVVCGIICEEVLLFEEREGRGGSKNAATDDGRCVRRRVSGRLGLKFDGTSTRVKEVFSDSPLVGKVYPGDVLKSVNGVLTFGTYLAIMPTTAAPRRSCFCENNSPRRPCTQRPSSAWAPWKRGPRRRPSAAPSVQVRSRPPRHRSLGPTTATLFSLPPTPHSPPRFSMCQPICPFGAYLPRAPPIFWR